MNVESIDEEEGENGHWSDQVNVVPHHVYVVDAVTPHLDHFIPEEVGGEYSKHHLQGKVKLRQHCILLLKD
jgi:hypothetical protein